MAGYGATNLCWRWGRRSGCRCSGSRRAGGFCLSGRLRMIQRTGASDSWRDVIVVLILDLSVLHLSGFRLKLLGLSPSILLFSQCFGKNFVIEIGAMAGRHLICESIALAVLFCAELLIGFGIRRPGASRAAQLLDLLGGTGCFTAVGECWFAGWCLRARENDAWFRGYGKLRLAYCTRRNGRRRLILGHFAFAFTKAGRRQRLIIVQSEQDEKSAGDCAGGSERRPARASEAQETARLSCALFWRTRRSWIGSGRCRRGYGMSKHLLFFRSLQRNLVRHFQLSEDGLAIRAADDMFFQGIQLLGEECALVIRRQRFRVRAGAALRSGRAGNIRSFAGRRGRAQMVRQRFVKHPIAFVRRHRLLHP